MAGKRQQDQEGRDPRGLGSLLALARLALFWERLWPALWPSFAILLIFGILAFGDLLPRLSGWLHMAALAVLALAFVASLSLGLRRLGYPDRAAGLRRLEGDSGYRHRPLTAWFESQASGGEDPESRSLWRAHRRRVREQLKNLRLKLPHAGLSRRDPLALRALLGLLFLVSLVAAGPDWRENLARALQPDLSGPDRAASVQLDLWVSPPAYTGQAPLVLATANPEAKALAAAGEERSGETAPVYRIPQASQLLVQVQGGEGEPLATLEGEPLGAFKALTGNSQRLEAEIPSSGAIEVSRGDAKLGSWQVEIVPDAAPEIEFLSAPQRTERASLRVEYLASDDYGVARAALRIRLIGRDDLAPEEVELLRPRPGLTEIEQSSFQDFTPHPWAGLPVELALLVEDALGQAGESDRIETVLPERIFQHPVARALVEQRKALTQAPDRRFPVARVLAQLYQHPEHFFDDIVVALAIHTAQRRLLFDKSDAAVTAVQDLLWKTALRIEEGELSLAERDLRDIMEALQRALAEGAPEEVIQRLMDQLQAALDRYIDEMARQAMQDLAEGNPPLADLDDAGEVIGRQDLQDLLDAARQMSEAGANQSAQELLAQLQQMLENLKVTSGSQDARDRRQAMEMMDRMNGMLDRQRELLDRSFRRSQENQDGQGEQREGQDGQPPGQAENQRDADGQGRLRNDLSDMMRRLEQMLNGDVPQALGEAREQMGRAEQALRGDRPGNAVDPQRRALQELQQGAQSLVDRFMEQFGQGQGGRAGAFGEGPGTSRDPLGRNPEGQGMGRTEGVEIPGVSERERALGIKRELQRRAGERDRPQIELDYLERLLRPF